MQTLKVKPNYLHHIHFMQKLMWDDSLRQDIQSLGQDFEANKKGSPFLHLEEILSSAAFLDEGFLKLKSFKYSSHVPFTIFPSYPVQAFQPLKWEEYMNMCQKYSMVCINWTRALEFYKDNRS